MRTKTNASRILWCEGVGFLAIIVLSWINEMSDLPHLVGGVQCFPNGWEGTLETLIVLLVAMLVIVLTKRLVSRLYRLEDFLRVCAWCKKLEHNGKWVPLEEFFESKFQTETSHGMCLAVWTR